MSAPGGRDVSRANEARYRDSIARAKQWLDELAIDPIELRKHQVKGKKKLTEQLDAYYRLVQVAEAAQRAALIERVKQVVAITYEPRFHDLASVDRQTVQAGRDVVPSSGRPDGASRTSTRDAIAKRSRTSNPASTRTCGSAARINDSRFTGTTITSA